MRRIEAAFARAKRHGWVEWREAYITNTLYPEAGQSGRPVVIRPMDIMQCTSEEIVPSAATLEAIVARGYRPANAVDLVNFTGAGWDRKMWVTAPASVVKYPEGVGEPVACLLSPKGGGGLELNLMQPGPGFMGNQNLLVMSG